MIEPHSITCTQITRPANFGEQFGNYISTFGCELPVAQEQWSDFFLNPNILIGAVAAVGTLGAVTVALVQSAQAKEAATKARSDAIEVAEASDQLALKREIRIKELEHYNRLWRLSAKLASLAAARTELHDQASVDLAFEYRSYLMYLSITAPNLVQPLSSLVQVFQSAVSALNESEHPTVKVRDGKISDLRFAKCDPELEGWKEARPNWRHELVERTGDVLNIMPEYYDGSKTEEETIESLESESKSLYSEYRPFIKRYLAGPPDDGQ